VALAEVREQAATRLRNHRVAVNQKRQAAAVAVVEQFQTGDSIAVGYVADLYAKQPAAFAPDFAEHLAAATAVSPEQARRIIAASFDL
jgi:hypothetical protein